MLDRLPPRQRQIIECKCKHDLTTRETGNRLGISGMTVKNHITLILRTFGMQSMHGVCYRYAKQERE